MASCLAVLLALEVREQRLEDLDRQLLELGLVLAPELCKRFVGAVDPLQVAVALQLELPLLVEPGESVPLAPIARRLRVRERSGRKQEQRQRLPLVEAARQRIEARRRV